MDDTSPGRKRRRDALPEIPQLVRHAVMANAAQFLGDVVEMRQWLEQAEYDAVQLARSMGMSWRAIGEHLGMSGESARSKFSHPKPRRRGRARQG